ncbi:MAG: transcription elongation factor GreA [Parcubacteria group bacterium Gr01-1014_31]|nr:MAG: transcription elongation factor GreA [Parcubacteria group bacterium Gr01-1014_31]
MRVPIRKPGKYTNLPSDPNLTAAKLDELKQELARLKSVTQPRAILEVKRLAEMGDFSENAAYSIAKGRLRHLNDRITELTEYLKHIVIIQPVKSGVVQLGSTVTVEINGKQKTYTILGSSETDPTSGVISHKSPVGAALMGCQVGDTVEIQLAGKRVGCRVVSLNY